MCAIPPCQTFLKLGDAMLYEIFMLPFIIFKYGFTTMFWITLVGGIYAVLTGNYISFRSPIVRNKYNEDK